MKKILLALAVGLMPAVAMVHNAAAQQPTDSVHRAGDSLIYAKNNRSARAVNDWEPINTAPPEVSATIAGENIKTISKRAVKNFNAYFQHAESVRWFTLQTGFIAYCKINGRLNRVYYDKRGNKLFSTQYYEEKQLPKDVRAIVKRTYYDYSIYGVQEITVADKIVYLVFIKDDETFKTLRIMDGEMEEKSSFKNMS